MSNHDGRDLSGYHRATLNRNFREAVRGQVSALCEGHRQERGQRGTYGGGWLSWPHLSELISKELLASEVSDPWDGDEVRKVIYSGDRVLPSDLSTRQLFLQAVQKVMNACFDTAERACGRPVAGQRIRFVQEFLGDTPVPTPFRPFNFDPTSVGFFRIIDWNAGRRLDPIHNIGETAKVSKRQELLRHHQVEDWVDPARFRTYLDEERIQPGSPCPTLVGYDEDTRETGNEKLRLRVDRSEYYEHVAVRRYLRDHPDEYDAVVARIGHGDQEGGLSSVVRSAPNSNIVVNVTVQSRNGLVMMLRRPVGARVWPRFYQAGAHETMNWSEPGRLVENCYELATRALREEVNLTSPSDYYDNIVFSWFGFYAVEASAYFFAHVKTALEEDELVRRATAAEAAFEIEDVDWYTLDRPTISKILETWSNGPWNPQPDGDDRHYLPHTTMSMTQLWRVTRQHML